MTMSGLMDFGERGNSRLGTSGTRTAAFVRELVAERVRQRLSCVEVVARMHGSWSVNTLYAVEQGTRAPTCEFLIMWAAALGRPLTLGAPS